VLDLTEEQLTYGPILVRLSPKRYAERLAANPDLAADFVREQALAGVSDAQLGWGHMLLDGHGVTRDVDAAFRWFNHAARQGNVEAWNMLGRCYELGWGVAANIEVAAHWYGLAAAKSHAWAQFNLAALMLSVEGERADLTRALSLLVASARAGNPKAMNLLGHFREKGWTRPPKLQAAALWFRLAARGGCYRGQFHHARFLLRQDKIPEAARWLRSSLTHSPMDFACEAAEMLMRHSEPHIARCAQEVMQARAARARAE
jgi:uncharacterized protein